MNPVLRVVLCLALLPGAILGCGKLPSRLKSSPVEPEVTEGDLSSRPAFEARGHRWRVREARPRTQAHLQSPFELGEVLSVHALVSETRAEFAAPVLWPKSESSRLILELSPAPQEPGARWSYRCLFPDGRVAEDGQQQGSVEPVLVDRESGPGGVGLILLEKVFGERGERQDPATQCHLEVTLSGEEPLVISLRALGLLPGLRVEVLEEHGMLLGEVIRTERWTNTTLRRVALQLAPQSTLESRQTVRETRYSESRGSPPPEARVRIRKARGKGFEVEASINGGPWSLAGLAKIVFGPGESHEIRFRLRLGRGMKVAQLPAPTTRRYEWVEEGGMAPVDFDRMMLRRATRTESTELLETQFLGSISWDSQLEEVGGWGERRPQSTGRSLGGELAGGEGDSHTEAFDWEGWVS